MNTLNPYITGSQTIRLRTMPVSGNLNFRLVVTNEETNKGVTINNVTASYDSQDFLNITANYSGSLIPENFYTLEVKQVSGSIECQTVYRGEIFATTGSPVLRNSIPLESYTGSNNQYIIY